MRKAAPLSIDPRVSPPVPGYGTRGGDASEHAQTVASVDAVQKFTASSPLAAPLSFFFYLLNVITCNLSRIIQFI